MKKFFIFSFLAIVAVVALALLVLGVENFRAQSAWRKFRARAESRGEKFEIKDFVPCPVPDEQNFASTPFFKPFFDFAADPKTGETHIRDWDAFDEAKLAFQWADECTNSPSGWRRAEFTDMAAWQASMRAACNRIPASQRGTSWFTEKALDPKLAVFRDVPVGAPADDILRIAYTSEAGFDELSSASRRPYSHFPIRYEDNCNALLPHLSVIKSVSRAFQARALGRLAKGDTNGAVGDVLAGLRVSGSLRGEPIAISELVRFSTFEITIQPIWEGMARHQWNEDQLRAIQAELEKVDFIPEMAHAMRGERAFNIAALDLLKAGQFKSDELMKEGNSWGFRLFPSCVFDRNKLFIGQAHEDCILPVLDNTNGVVDIDMLDHCNATLYGRLSSKSPNTVFARILLPASEAATLKTCSAQATANLALTACALERYRLVTGQYPESLTQLSPRYLSKLPIDPVNGSQLHYRRTEDGLFFLYSISTDLQDDDGEVHQRKGRAGLAKMVYERAVTGDWVWRYPSPEAK